LWGKVLGSTAGEGNHGHVYGNGQNKGKHAFQLLNESLIRFYFSRTNGQNIRKKIGFAKLGNFIWFL
jgi:hypothetical protein